MTLDEEGRELRRIDYLRRSGVSTWVEDARAIELRRRRANREFDEQEAARSNRDEILRSYFAARAAHVQDPVKIAAKSLAHDIARYRPLVTVPEFELWATGKISQAFAGWTPPGSRS